jgi:hypothetical protein
MYHLETIIIITIITLSSVIVGYDFVDWLSSMTSLRSLKLHECPTSTIPAGYVWPSSLESISFNVIHNRCEMIHRMVKGDISIPPNLTELQIDAGDGCHWAPDSSIAIALHHLPHLRSLRFPQCHVIDSSLLPSPAPLTSLTLLDLFRVDNIVSWVNELPSLSNLRLGDWDDKTADQLHCRHLTSFHAGNAHNQYPSIWSIFKHHKQLQQLSMYIDHDNGRSSAYDLPSLTSLRFTFTVASLDTSDTRISIDIIM